MIDKITLIGAAKLFQVHPRTIVRALSGEHNTYWYEDINEHLYSVKDIAEVYGMTQFELSRCIEGRDRLLKPSQAAKELNIGVRLLRLRAKNGKIKKHGHGNIVRYLQSKVNESKVYYRKDI